MGSVEPLRKLHSKWGQHVRFIEVITRQEHPGRGAPPYRSFEEKLRDARRYQIEENISWPVLVDDLAGTTHQVYGGLPDPAYIIDAEGRVVFYNMWTHVPTLETAIQRLIDRGGRGVVTGGMDRIPHMLAAITDGWRALRRGLPQSYIDLELSVPGAASATWLGYQMRPLLAPIALRATPLPRTAKLVLGLGGIAALAMLSRRFIRV